MICFTVHDWLYNCAKMRFALVEFSEDRSVDIVPISWLVDDNCFWPPYRAERLVNAIRKSEEPLQSWSKYSVRVLGLFGMYKCVY